MKSKREFYYFILSLIFLSCSSSTRIQEYGSALKAYDEGRYQTAITFIDRAIEKNKNEPEYYILRARANYKIGNKIRSINDLNKSIEIGKDFNAYYLRGKIFLEAGDLENAKRDFREAYALNSESANLLFDLGYLEYLNGENQLALEYYTKASKLDSRNSATFVNMGNLYATMGDSKSAIDNYSKALVLDPNDGIAYYNRANEKMLLNDVNGAIEDFENSIIIDSLNINTFFEIAEAKIKVNNIEGTIENYNSILKIDSTSARAFYLRGRAEILLGETEKACKDFKNSGDLGFFDAYEMIKKYCNQSKDKLKKKNNKKSKRK
jgi:tetratricopeptide (TPR) repeat protein